MLFMEESENNKEHIIEIEFNFQYDSQHEIDGDVLSNYILLINKFCKNNDCNCRYCPPEPASYKQKAILNKQNSTGQSLSQCFVDCLQNFSLGCNDKTLQQNSMDFGKLVSHFFKSLLKNCKCITSITFIETNKKSPVDIPQKDFPKYILDEEKEDKKENKIIKVHLDELEVTEKGNIIVPKDFVEKIKKENEQYKKIMEDFKNEDVNINKKQQQVSLFLINNESQKN